MHFNTNVACRNEDFLDSRILKKKIIRKKKASHKLTDIQYGIDIKRKILKAIKDLTSFLQAVKSNRSPGIGFIHDRLDLPKAWLSSAKK